MGVWSAAGGKLPGTNGGRGSRGGSGAQIQHGLLGEALTFRAWAVFHLHDKVSKNVIKIKKKLEEVKYVWKMNEETSVFKVEEQMEQASCSELTLSRSSLHILSG